MVVVNMIGGFKFMVFFIHIAIII